MIIILMLALASLGLAGVFFNPRREPELTSKKVEKLLEKISRGPRQKNPEMAKSRIRDILKGRTSDAVRLARASYSRTRSTETVIY